MPLEQILPANAWALLLVFCRVGGAITLLPGFGDAYVPARIRAVIALGVTFVLTPVVAAGLPAQPTSAAIVIAIIFDEIFIGSFIGLIARVLLASLETAGAIIATQASLSNAITFNPGAATSESLPSSLFGALAVVLIFATNLHFVFLRAIVESYSAFPAGKTPIFDDMSHVMTRLVARSFEISVQIAAPYLLLGVLFYIALGLIGRIMPQLQIFYIALPLQLMGGLLMLSLTISASMIWFLRIFGEALSSITEIR